MKRLLLFLCGFFFAMTEVILILFPLFYPDRRTDPILIGDENPALLIITAENHGEGAYETELFVHLPPQTHYQGVLSDEEVNAISLTLN